MTDLTPIMALAPTIDTEPAGEVGRLQEISLDRLGIDAVFQRVVSQASARNIQKIAREFDWRKFLPVIVVPVGDRYSVIDGQHRSIAAATIGIKAVPAYVLDCTTAEAAGAFAAINGNVTPVSPVDVWFARLAAGDPESLQVDEMLQRAGVKVVRKKSGHRPGESRSIKPLIRAVNRYPEHVFITTIQCIAETGDGNAGMLTGAVINGVAKAIQKKTDLLAEPSRLFDIFDNVSLTEIMEDARTEAIRRDSPTQFIFTRMLNEEIRRATA